MNKYIFSFLIVLIPSIASGQLGNVVKDMAAGPSGSVSSEKEIKFSYQEHSSAITEYSIAFFEAIGSNSGGSAMEFWGHGRKFLAIYSDIDIEYADDDLKAIIKNISDNYNYFNAEIRKKNRLFIHSDINLDENFIFSCYMDFQTPKFAFWYYGNKYIIEEKQLTQMLDKFNLYFDF
jgi:hypothetical protein